MGLEIPTFLSLRVTVDEKKDDFGKYPKGESIHSRNLSWQGQATPSCLVRATESGGVGSGVRENGACW